MTIPDFLDSDEQEFASSLQTLVRDEHPDLEGILAGATRDGRRRRLRRRVGVGLATAACVGGFATAYVVIPGAGHDGGNEPHVTSAIDRHTSIERVGRVTVLRQDGTPLAVLGGNADQQLRAVLTHGKLPKSKAYAFERDAERIAELKALFPGITDWKGALVVSVVDRTTAPHSGGLRDRAPVTLGLPGWNCDYFPVDDKAWCPGPGDVSGGYVVRPAADRDGFLGKSGGAGSTMAMLGGEGIVAQDGTIIGPVHNGIFVTVQSGMGFTPELMAEFAQSLSWTE